MLEQAFILLCRYETSVLQHQPKKDWSIAARHYRLAMAVFPSGECLDCHLIDCQDLHANPRQQTQSTQHDVLILQANNTGPEMHTSCCQDPLMLHTYAL